MDLRQLLLFPTHVGMFRVFQVSAVCQCSFPHTRGDVPRQSSHSLKATSFSPHTWGCSALRRAVQQAGRLFPTHVGMFRSSGARSTPSATFPHTRGDVPPDEGIFLEMVFFSPHTWGCSDHDVLQAVCIHLFPTHVGMFLTPHKRNLTFYPFPHTRGDVPNPLHHARHVCRFSPHTWGCSDQVAAIDGACPLFPTHVGMFRKRIMPYGNWRPFPHTRGDVPWPRREARQAGTFSPHTWGCSDGYRDLRWREPLFPTHVGMFRGTRRLRAFREAFPHTRGDVPRLSYQNYAGKHFSPHTWGCSEIGVRRARAGMLFPTHVGMFRCFCVRSCFNRSFPHTRGDVPPAHRTASCHRFFSPHTWGCSENPSPSSSRRSLFPTHVGMFRFT